MRMRMRMRMQTKSYSKDDRAVALSLCCSDYIHAQYARCTLAFWERGTLEGGSDLLLPLFLFFLPHCGLLPLIGVFHILGKALERAVVTHFGWMGRAESVSCRLVARRLLRERWSGALNLVCVLANYSGSTLHNVVGVGVENSARHAIRPQLSWVGWLEWLVCHKAGLLQCASLLFNLFRAIIWLARVCVLSHHSAGLQLGAVRADGRTRHTKGARLRPGSEDVRHGVLHIFRPLLLVLRIGYVRVLAADGAVVTAQTATFFGGIGWDKHAASHYLLLLVQLILPLCLVQRGVLLARPKGGELLKGDIGGLAHLACVGEHLRALFARLGRLLFSIFVAD
mmetsp:Transcript_20562/g.52846  ORF Transcript_20562/g.52846 Transcript_20562/m.52846 type:complete len:339 (-) Transcript_20562:293-1309(-)